MAPNETSPAGTGEPEKVVNDPYQGTSTPENKDHPRTITGWKVSTLIEG